ncbi:hypothetical protein BCR32DRAFT_294843 [Anaeromyces robustus]|uniref:Uncharacterized protein n=1 Tax=Anaeromyces robustus TaxID=1754192 RepID=A0A1Y1WZ08_9FUNG|nr:hypothetical protein BCR32DRAFT_294843 [Anaeromyces robustus]|eukprot:ORX78791.1 hypothetical protein BCR32DRAFT_294843 [Anaeromyces robustus]
MNTINTDSDMNHYLNEGNKDYVSYASIYNEVLDKVKQGLEKQRSGSSILKKNSKKNEDSFKKKEEMNVHSEDIALFQEDDSDDSDSDDFLEWENSDNDLVYTSRFRGGLTRAKSHINDINDYNHHNKVSQENNTDIIKDRIVLNKHFQKIYGFNDTSFRHGNYEIFNNDINNDNNNDKNDDTNNKSFQDSEKELKEVNMKQEETPITENITESSNEIVASTLITENNNDENGNSRNDNDDLEKQFYTELRRASMIIDLQQHYRIRDGLKNKEDLKQEIVEGYNALHNEKYSSEDLPDFQNLENITEVKAKMIQKEDNTASTTNKNTLSVLNEINEATKNYNDESQDNSILSNINENNLNKNNHENENKEEEENSVDNQLVNDTWKFLFNNPYSLQFLSKSIKNPSSEKLSNQDSLSTEIDNTIIIPLTEVSSSTEKNIKKTEKEIEEDEVKTDHEEGSTSYNSNLELDNSLMSKILNINVKNEKQLKESQKEKDAIRKSKENDWLSFVQKELASININSSSNSQKQKENQSNYNKKEDYSKYIPNKIPTAPKLEFTIEPDN